jgi:aubergine-like protein
MLFDERKSTVALFCKKNLRIHEYELSTDIGGSLHSYYSFLNDRFKVEGNACLISGKTLYLRRPLLSKVTTIPVRNRLSRLPDVTLTFRCEMALKSAKDFFNSLFGKIVDHLNDFGDPQQLSSLDDSKTFQSQMYQGHWTSNVLTIRPHENGVLLKFDIGHKLICQRSVYEFIQQELKENIKRYDSPRTDLVAKSFIGKHAHSPNIKILSIKNIAGKTVMTRYDGKVYVIDDVDFESTPNHPFQDDDKLMSFADLYKQKYNIELHHMMQPILINRVQFTSPATGEIQRYVRCLIPELCYPVYSEW